MLIFEAEAELCLLSISEAKVELDLLSISEAEAKINLISNLRGRGRNQFAVDVSS